jgi:4-diphosphocytidyl-2-C-methyl-D-erythritol kinase
MLTLPAYAKINLVLEVLGRRDDGYHEVATVMQTLSLQDTLSLEKGKGMELSCNIPGLVSGDNLVLRAARMLQEATGYSGGARIFLHKRIPVAGGLGGGSSDAAAVLQGLNQLWELNLSRDRLVELAARLGSDVPFFLYGGTALARGRGEKITPLPSLSPSWVVLLLRAPLGQADKTRALYSRLEPRHFSQGEFAARAVTALRRGERLDSSLLFNVFEQVIGDFFPGLAEERRCFLACGATSVHLAGSGPTLFSLVEEREKAEEICSRLRSRGREADVAHTI